MKAVFFLMFCLRMSGGDINSLEIERIKPTPRAWETQGSGGKPTLFDRGPEG